VPGAVVEDRREERGAVEVDMHSQSIEPSDETSAVLLVV